MSSSHERVRGVRRRSYRGRCGAAASEHGTGDAWAVAGPGGPSGSGLQLGRSGLRPVAIAIVAAAKSTMLTHSFESQAGDGVGVVDPHPFDEEPAERVPGDVDREQTSGAESMAAFDEEDEADEGQVPQRLVQEGRVGRWRCVRVRGSVGGVDVDGPTAGWWGACRAPG
jgi:hypothetical protein